MGGINVTLSVKDLMAEPTAVASIVGAQLTLAQLSDVIQGFILTHPNEQPMTDMLVDWLQTHGRFE